MLISQSFMLMRHNAKKRMYELIQADKTDSAEFTNTNLQLIQLNRMLCYIAKGNWASVRVREVFAYWIKANYNVSQTAQHYRMPVQIVEQMIKQADKVISGKIEKPLQMICNGKVHEGSVTFYNNINKPLKGKKRSSNINKERV